MAADLFANRPTIAATGSLFISSDTFKFYRFNGSTWDLIGDGGITGNLTSGYIPIATGTGTLGDSNISYTATPGGIQEGIFNTNPNISYVTQISATTLRAVGFDIADGTSTWNFQRVYESAVAYNEFYSARTNVRFKLFNGVSNTFHTFFQNGQVTFGGQTTAGYKVDIVGDLRVQNSGTSGSQLTLDSSTFYTTINFSNAGTTGWLLQYRSSDFFFQKNSVDQFSIYDGQGLYGTQSLSIGGATASFANAKFNLQGNKNASGGNGRGAYFNNTITATANNDVLTALDIVPTFTNGAFTGVHNIGVKVNNGYSQFGGGGLFVYGNTVLTPSGYSGSYIQLSTSGADSFVTSYSSATSNFQKLILSGSDIGFNHAGGNKSFYVFATTLNATLGYNTPVDSGFKFDINGNSRFVGQIQFTVANCFNYTIINSYSYFKHAAGSGMIFAPANQIDSATMDAITIMDNTFGIVAYSANTNTFNALSIAPKINTTGGTNTVRGIYYNPLLTSTTGTTNIAFQNTSGNVFFGTTSGNVGIGATTTLNAAAILQITSTTQGVLFPRMTTTQKNAIASPVAGLVVYDTTLNKLCVYTTAWQTITSV